MLAYSEQVSNDNPDPSELTIKFKNLKKFISCVFKLTLGSTGEIMLDYPIGDLAQATAMKCMEFAGVSQDDAVNLDQVVRFIEGAKPGAIFKK